MSRSSTLGSLAVVGVIAVILVAGHGGSARNAEADTDAASRNEYRSVRKCAVAFGRRFESDDATALADVVDGSKEQLADIDRLQGFGRAVTAFKKRVVDEFGPASWNEFTRADGELRLTMPDSLVTNLDAADRCPVIVEPGAAFLWDGRAWIRFIKNDEKWKVDGGAMLAATDRGSIELLSKMTELLGDYLDDVDKDRVEVDELRREMGRALIERLRDP